MRNYIQLAAIPLILTGLMACSNSTGTSGNPANPDPAVPTTARNTANDDQAQLNKKGLDLEIAKDTSISSLKDRKTVLEFRDDIILDSSEVYFQNGELVTSDVYLTTGVYCRLNLRAGKSIYKSDQITFSYKSSSGSGHGGAGYLDFISTTVFTITDSEPKLKNMDCTYRGNDALFDIKVSDLESTFGSWATVLIYQKGTK